MTKLRYLPLALLPLFLLSAQAAAQAFDSASLEQRLSTQLGDEAVAEALTRIVIDDVLTWQPPTVAPAEVDTIIAFAFGNRILPNGNREPGPMNEALADKTVQLYRETGVPVYAQWEIAEAIGDRIPAADLTSVNPEISAEAEVVYLSTTGVVEAVLADAGGELSALGKVAVIGFADHVRRCVLSAHAFGLDAAAPEGYDMPQTYDAQSGQPWTRDRLTYLTHDLYARLAGRRAQLVAEQ